MNAVLGGTLVIGAVFVLLNLVSDLLYRLLDPRTADGRLPSSLPTLRLAGLACLPNATRWQARLGRGYLGWRAFTKNPLAVIGLGIVILLILVAIFADVIAPYSPSPAETCARSACCRRARPTGSARTTRRAFSRASSTARASPCGSWCWWP